MKPPLALTPPTHAITLITLTINPNSHFLLSPHSPLSTHSLETWAIRKTDENRLFSFERKNLKRIFEPVKDNVTSEWKIRKNEKLESLYQKPNIVEAIRTKRLHWAGHAWRNQNPLIHTVLENPIGKRPIRRPKMRWEDVVKKDMEELGGGNDLMARVENREDGRMYDVMVLEAANTQKRKKETLYAGLATCIHC